MAFSPSQVTPRAQCMSRWIRDFAAAQDTAFGLRPCLVTWAVLEYLVVASPCAFLVSPLLSGHGPGLAPLARCSGRPCRCSVVIELGAAQSHCGRELARVCAGRRPLATGRAQPRPHQPRRPHDQRGDPRGSSPTVLHLLCSCLPLRFSVSIVSRTGRGFRRGLS
jgi:hypothetical protein